MSFDAWLRKTTPSYNWDWPYIQYLRAALDRVTTGQIDRLIINLPPRHGKSSIATIRYSAYHLISNPSQRVIIGAYNQKLAMTFSRAVRRIVRKQIMLNDERTAQDEWETLQEGGLRAVGVGSGVTGVGGNLIILDDPFKSREEAESEAYRDRCWDWYTNDIFTRREPGASLILINTRWHMDDLAGRILASEDGKNWTVISLPAEAEENDPLGRSIGEALCPDRFPADKLHEIKSVLGMDYYALYQQRPQAREGGMFHIDWFNLCDAVPAKAKRVRWWDKGATDRAGDYTAGVLIAHVDKVWYIEDVIRGQWGGGERDKIIRATAEQDKLKYGHVEYWGPQDPGQAGKIDAAAFISLLAGFVTKTQPETGPKEVRAGPLASQAWAGNIYVLRAAWTAKFIQELCEFPSGQHDDQVDAASGAFAKLPPVGSTDWLDYMKQSMAGNEPNGDGNGNGHEVAQEVIVPQDDNGHSVEALAEPGTLAAIEQEQRQLGRNAPRVAGQWTNKRRIG
jgi:predicted phage terminase large subunit-like protein